jgi:probable phosphoglycerate mutase
VSEETRTIYVIRHGSTELNEAHRIRGHANVPLSPLGHEEVRKLGAALASSNIGIIFHSDLDRATDTAAAVAKATGAKEYSTKLLRPWNLGDYTGRASSEVHPSIVSSAENTPGRPIKGGESFFAFVDRAKRGIIHALLSSEGEPLALVTHHRVERWLQAKKAAGWPSGREVDLEVMFQHGEDPAHAEKLGIPLGWLGYREGLEGADVEGPEHVDGGKKKRG